MIARVVWQETKLLLWVFSQIEDVMKRLLLVPKSELDQRLKEHHQHQLKADKIRKR